MNNPKEYNFYLLEKNQKKSTYLLAEITGILLLFLGIVMLYGQQKTGIATPWSIIMPIGLGLGFVIYSSVYLFGNAYATINSEQIIYKPYIYKKEKYVNWDKIVMVRTKFSSLELITSDNYVMRLDLSKASDAVIDELENFVYSMAKEKSIQTDK